MEKVASKCKDENSGLLLRPDTRVCTEDEITAKANGRKFISLEDIDSYETRQNYNQMLQTQGAYTIGVIVDKQERTTAQGKKFIILKLSDLIKYDIKQVKEHLAKTLEPKMKAGKCNSNETKIALKSYTKSGYKQVSFMCFGDSHQAIHEFRHGCVVAMISPKYMKGDRELEYGISFSIEAETQFMMIGYSEDYTICCGKNKSSQVTAMNTFKF